MQRPDKTVPSIPRLRSRDGFTFIEAAIALAIVSICIVTLLALNTTSINLADSANQTAQAALLAEQKMAEILAIGYPQPAIDSGSAQINSFNFQWRTEVANAEPPIFKQAITAGLRKVTVDVTWNRGQAAKNLRISSYAADRGLK